MNLTPSRYHIALFGKMQAREIQGLTIKARKSSFLRLSRHLVDPKGLEPSTSRMRTERSPSYGPINWYSVMRMRWQPRELRKVAGTGPPALPAELQAQVLEHYSTFCEFVKSKNQY